ncbi:MAG TPA: hypothetical protein VH109_14560 [Steroidobacteraceae bacterium]|jgi:hypothetical protein|nr:hypothetical protein [Steroidobacteraceae bacterium]
MRFSLTVVALLLAIYAAPAFAERDPQSGAPLPPKKREPASPITDHFSVRAAFYAPGMNTNLRVDPTNPPPGVTGTPVNAESDLGLPDKMHQGRVELMFRMRDRNKIRLDYFEADRSGTAVLNRDVVFGNETFLSGSVTQSSLDWKQFDITYTYSFIRSAHVELGTGIAVYFLQADAIGFVPATNQRQEVSAATPFPALPLDFVWAISSRWALTAHGAYLRAHLAGFDGWYVDYQVDAQYRWNPNFAVGAGWAAIRTSLERSSGVNPGVFAMSASGPQAFIRFSF